MFYCASNKEPQKTERGGAAAKVRNAGSLTRENASASRVVSHTARRVDALKNGPLSNAANAWALMILYLAYLIAG